MTNEMKIIYSKIIGEVRHGSKSTSISLGLVFIGLAILEVVKLKGHPYR